MFRRCCSNWDPLSHTDVASHGESGARFSTDPPPLLRPRHRARWPAACGSIAQSSPLCASRWRPGSCPARATGLHKLLCDVILHTHQRRAMGCRRENARDLRPACTQRAGNGAVTHVCRERRARLRATRCGGHLLASLAYPRVPETHKRCTPVLCGKERSSCLKRCGLVFFKKNSAK